MEFADSAPIKNLLTTELVPLFEKAAEATERVWTSQKKDRDDEPPPTVTVPRTIAKRLGDCGFRTSVCTEIATLYFDATLSFFDRLDADHNLLAFDDGVFDLSTKEFRPTSPDDHITRTTGYSYSGSVDAPDPKDVARLGHLLTKIFPDIETRQYVVAQTSQWLNGRTGKHLWHLLIGGAFLVCFRHFRDFGDSWNIRNAILIRLPPNLDSRPGPRSRSGVSTQF